MRFPYAFYVGVSSDTGEPIAIFRPEIPIRIYGPGGHREPLVLIDTGSDNTIFSSQIASDLGIETTPGQGPDSRAFGGQDIPVSFADVELELSAGKTELRWRVRVYFADFDSGPSAAIAGHDGFLEFFTATFDGELCELELDANSYLPVVR